MTRHKWNLHWSLAVVLALAIGCGYWGLAGGCATPGDGGGNGDEPEEIVVSESTCEPAEEEGGEFEVLVQAVSSEGRQLSFTKHVVTPPGGDAGFQTETEVTADGELVMSMITSNGPTRAEVQIEYGSLVPGMSSASAVV